MNRCGSDRDRTTTFEECFMAALQCPECAADLDIDDGVEQGEIIPCPECGADLEVLGVKPTVLGLAPEEGEDWGE